ncbi:MAG: Chorismate dehydratase [Bacteroidetes bacterium ADurb.Bin408]|nr:MAG: Chorismate dehydratase [Bacteroidetes bacterium ADurb.Bin408]
MVSYINSYPFVYGLMKCNTEGQFNLHLCPPSECAADAMSGQADVALIPAAALNTISREYTLFDGFCIGADKSVASVLLLSNTPLSKIKFIHLDTHSVTTANLVKVLAEHYWGIKPTFEPAEIHAIKTLNDGEAMIAIGDKCFDIRKNFRYVFDMYDEWFDFCQRPFVFAVWVIRKDISMEQKEQLADALKFGVSHKNLALEALLPDDKKGAFAYYLDYITENISYYFDEEKKNALAYFLELINRLPTN